MNYQTRQQVVTAEQFTTTYTPDCVYKYPYTDNAAIAHGTPVMNTPYGTVVVCRGDYIVAQKGGGYFPMSAEQFEKRYETVPEPAPPSPIVDPPVSKHKRK